MNKKIVALAGLKGSGKDTAASALIADGYTNVKFADALKNMMRALFRTAGADSVLIERLVEGDLKEEPTEYLKGRTPRHAMQTLGTEWGRDMIDKEIWTHLTLSAIDAAPGDVVITDLRFPNELELLRNLNATIFRVERGPVVPQSLHPSELFVAEMDVPVLANDGSISDLHDKIRKAVQ